MTYIQAISDKAGGVQLDFRYDARVIALLKLTIPASHRQYNPLSKTWTIAGPKVDELFRAYRDEGYIVDDRRDKGGSGNGQALTDTLRINYLGNPRMRSDGAVWASGMDESGNWRYILPYSVLTGFFNIDAAVRPSLFVGTLYDVLDVSDKAAPDVIKRQYRAAVRRWHPDTGGNADDFRVVQEAYEILSDEKRRRKYDLARGWAKDSQAAPSSGTNEIVWITPADYRAGYWNCIYTALAGRIYIEQLLSFDPVTNSAGQRLYSHWSDNGVVYDWR